MRKVLLGIMIFLIMVSVGIIGAYLFYINEAARIKENTKKISDEIIELTRENVDIEELKEKYKKDLEQLKENAKNKLEEQEIWEKAKEKLEQALLS